MKYNNNGAHDMPNANQNNQDVNCIKMNVFEIFLSNFNLDIKEKKSFLISFREFFSSTEYKSSENPFVLFLDSYFNYPNTVSKIIERINFGWITNLPDYSLNDIFALINKMTSQEVADKVMQKKLNYYVRKKLFEKLVSRAKKYKQAQETILDAIKSFNHKCYTACSLCLFALIDSCFIIGQPIKDNKARSLARAAIDKIGDNMIIKYSIIASLVCVNVKSLFKSGNDFKQVNEKGLNRNYLSHGMNKYIPNRTDCLKLFDLLYNIYFLFDTELFKWDRNVLKNEEE